MVEFDADSIRTVAIQGNSNRTTGRALMPDDPVRIASISKFFVALGVMRLVETGKLDLNADVNDYLEWDLRNPAFPDAPITLSDLMSHRSGLRDGINYALPMDALLKDALADPKAWESKYPPGAYFAYANLNSPVIAAVMEAATGERFDKIMQQEVFTPLGLGACFNWINCSNANIAAAVTLYRENGEVARDDLRGRREDCSVVPAEDGSCDLSEYKLGWTGSVFSPQGGLRISVMDLAKVGQMFLREGDGFLKRKNLEVLAGPVWKYDGSNGDSENGYFCAYGLGMHVLNYSGAHKSCKDQPFKDGKTYWGHSGEAYSLRSGLWFEDSTYQGVAFFRTEVPDAEPADHCIYFCR